MPKRRSTKKEWQAAWLLRAVTCIDLNTLDGDEWLKNDLFRFGASDLLTDLERQLYHFITGHYAAKHHMPMG